MSVIRGFCGPSYTAQSPLNDGEQTMNLYPEVSESPSALSKITLYNTPGLQPFASLSQGPVRGIFGQSDRCLAVGGMHLFDIDRQGVPTDRGTMDFDSSPATMTTNGDGGDELFITSGGTGYVLNLTSNVLTDVVDDVTVGSMLDGYFLALDVATSTFKISDVLDGLSWDPTQIAQRSSASDPWRAMLVIGKNIWLFGESTTELWYNSGDSPFPFAPFPGALIPMGIAATFSAAKVGVSAIWLAQNAEGQRTVVKAQGITTTKISTFAVDYALAQYARVDDAEAYCYQELGHTFYVLNLPSANKTWVYDDTQGLWHERGDWSVSDNQYNVDRPRCHAAIYDRHLVGDRDTGTIYTMSTAIHTNADGDGLRWLRRTAGTMQEGLPQVSSALRLFVDTGQGLVSGQGSDPQVCLRYSDDAGRTWSNELWRAVGPLGQYGRIVEWNRLGRSRGPRVWEISSTDPIAWRILGAWLNPQRVTRAA